MLVYVYRNLRVGSWSIKSLDGRRHYGRVIAHVKSLVLEMADFRVSEKGRQRVIREQRKNVHAGVRGYLKSVHDGVAWRYPFDTSLICENDDFPRVNKNAELVTHNPYKYDSFVWVRDEVRVLFSPLVIFYPTQVYAVPSPSAMINNKKEQE